MVREELQAEMLRLQNELHKTIVFVTHDIDEAVKLGDKVAVFGPGGVLQQYDEPPRLLANPANDFVAGFIGADRGYRGLQFFHASGLPLHDLSRVGEWELVTKPDGSPLGWRNAADEPLARRAEVPDEPLARRANADGLVAGGSLLRPDGTLRDALDAALSSPSGVGVAVDAEGKVICGVRVEDVLEALAVQRAMSARTESRGQGR